MKNINKYAEWTEFQWKGENKENLTERDYTIMGLGLAGETGEALEHMKKRVRDNVLNEEEFKKELGDVIYYWCRICKAFGYLPSEVIQMNVDKLNKRNKEKGKLL